MSQPGHVVHTGKGELRYSLHNSVMHAEHGEDYAVQLQGRRRWPLSCVCLLVCAVLLFCCDRLLTRICAGTTRSTSRETHDTSISQPKTVSSGPICRPSVFLRAIWRLSFGRKWSSMPPLIPSPPCLESKMGFWQTIRAAPFSNPWSLRHSLFSAPQA